MKKKISLLCALFCGLLPAAAQSTGGYRSLDPSDPIVFGGDHIVYQNQKIALGKNAFFLDGRLPDVVAERHPYVFNTIRKALAALSDGTEAEPMTLYIAPWVDDPDDPAIRQPVPGVGGPFGAVVECEWLRFYGLTEDPANVVLACNRGQTHGSNGNFTMFNIRGDGLSAENVTFGNYCNIDLEFPLVPALNRPRRASAIVQAQLVFSNADRAWARNTRFVSRLNLCPFSGAKRLLFDRCYFECTDDALAPTGVYLNSRLVIFSSRPFYSTRGDGAVFLNCDFEFRTSSRQYFTKSDSPVAVIDSRFHHRTDDLYIDWSGAPRDEVRGYQSNVTLNGKPYRINGEAPFKTVDLTGKAALTAYRVEYGGEVVYNTYNLLRGDDDWDPMGVKERIVAAGRAAGKDYANRPLYLRLTPPQAALTVGDSTVRLQAEAFRKGMFAADRPEIVWSYTSEGKDPVALRPDGASCEVIGTNADEIPRAALLIARTPDGLEGAARITVTPAWLDAPAFIERPRIGNISDGRIAVEYTLDLAGRADESQITWYRCTDRSGADPVEVGVSRLDRPLKSYTLTPGDAGHYLMVSVAPKHLRSHPGQALRVVTEAPVRAEDIRRPRVFSTDFVHFPSANQPKIRPGAWTLGGYKPSDTDAYDWQPVTDRENWAYIEGLDGSAGVLGMTPIEKGARMVYTPVEGVYGDMTVEIAAAPGKAAAQGFGSATAQYMDVFIQYDTRTMSGYGLRIIRTNKFGDAVDFILMRHENGVAQEIAPPVSSDAYRTTCTIRLAVEGSRLTADASTDAPTATRTDVVSSVHLEADIVPTAFGGTGFQFTGSTGAGSTWLRSLRVEWE
jgi:hypothetical protein